MTRTGVTPLVPSIMNAVYDRANRMTMFNGTAISYDGNGNPLSLMGMELTWNQKGQLTNVTGAAAGPIEYRYDAMGRRVSKIVNSVTTNYLYDGLNLIAELDGDNSNAPIAWYVYAGLDRPLARVAADGSVVYYHQDILGSVIALTDASGSVVTTYNYSPFGKTEVTHVSGQVDQPFQFTGREYDPETGLYFYRARYYSPIMRRFISADPLRFGGGDVNWYAYVGGNPVNFKDPQGLARCTYSISSHSLSCRPNNGGSSIVISDDVHSGRSKLEGGNCENNNSRSCQRDFFDGPIPEGTYKMNRDDREGNDGYWRLEPQPKVHWWEYWLRLKRAGFLLHPGSTSHGCINVRLTNPLSLIQYYAIDSLLQKENDNNNLTVIP